MKINTTEAVAKTIMLGCIIGFMVLFSGGCNRQIFDTTWRFQKAHIRGISTSNEWTTVEITSWKDFHESDVVQIKTKSGKTYLTHYNNIVMETN